MNRAKNSTKRANSGRYSGLSAVIPSSPLPQATSLPVNLDSLKRVTEDDAISRHLFLQLQILGWGGFLVFGLLFARSSILPWHETVSIVILRTVLGLGVTTSLRPAYRRLRDRPIHPGLRAGILFAASGVIALSDSLALLGIMRTFHLVEPARMEQFLYNSSSLRWLIYFVWGMLYFGIHYWLQTRHTQLRLARLEAAARASELQILRAQINPHFLFNALNSILAEAKNAGAVTALTQALSDYLRFSLQQKGHLHALGVELDALENYLLVEKARFEESLDYSIKASAEARSVPVPIALVQTLLDNAIKYGQCSDIRPVRIAITAAVEGKMFRLQVANSGEWVTNSSSTGTGIANLYRRLQLLYSDQAELTYHIVPGQVIANVHLPVTAHEKGGNHVSGHHCG